MTRESYQLDNLAEEEFGQLHAIHLSEDAVAAVRAKIPTGPSLSHCEDCGEDIPVERQRAQKGCKTCVHCQSIRDRSKYR